MAKKKKRKQKSPKKKPRDKDWESLITIWIVEHIVRLREIRRCAKTARFSAIYSSKIANLNDREAELILKNLNQGIKDANVIRKAMGLKLIQKRK